jgi:hypothetical protein
MDWLADKIVAAKEQLRQEEQLAADPHADPRDAHEAGAEAKRLRMELDRMLAASALSAQMVKTLGQLINTLRVAGYESHARTTAMTQLQTAQLWLMTETK